MVMRLKAAMSVSAGTFNSTRRTLEGAQASSAEAASAAKKASSAQAQNSARTSEGGTSQRNTRYQM